MTKKDKKPNVLVTGAAGGIGEAICEVFSQAGYRVIGVDRLAVEAKPYEMLRFDIGKLGDKDDDSVEAFYAQIEECVGGEMNALINNAAIQIIRPVENVTVSDWEKTLNTNLLASFWLTQRFLPLLRAARGSVVNIASIHATLTKPGFSMYATSKGALVSLTKALALELAPVIRVNAIIPAATDTPMLRSGFKENPEGFQRLAKYHPMERIARPQEVAQLALYLAGQQAGFITGSAMSIDGGIGACLHDPGV
jgi:NAD(P)-dependent dehydrogenase (short-subunit alcohol dehydrogenase family)